VSDPIRFATPLMGVFDDGLPDVLRWSTAKRRLHDQGSDDVIAKIEAERAVAGTSSPTHGTLEDPIIAILGDRVAFVCPRCSGEDVQRAYEAEGKRGAA
jgi:hypothetical protein